jgi:hypothetical protein
MPMLYTPEEATVEAGLTMPTRLAASFAGQADVAGTTFRELEALSDVPESWRLHGVVSVQTKSANAGPSTAKEPIVYSAALGDRPQQSA